MRKRRMIVIVNENYEVSTKFHGSTEELSRCNKALARHIKEQARVSSILANAANYQDERPALVTRKQPEVNPDATRKNPSIDVSPKQYKQHMEELNILTKGAQQK